MALIRLDLRLGQFDVVCNVVMNVPLVSNMTRNTGSKCIVDPIESQHLANYFQFIYIIGYNYVFSFFLNIVAMEKNFVYLFFEN